MEETALQTALRAWVVNSSGLDDARVVWSEQAIVRLPFPFITMRLGDLIPVGQDEVTYKTDLTKPAGQEVTETVIGRRVLPVSIQCFGDGAADSTRQILSRVQTSLRLTRISGALHEAGISVFDQGQVQNVTAPRETVFEPRSLLEVRCYVAEVVSGSLTYISTVQITNELTETVIIVTL